MMTSLPVPMPLLLPDASSKDSNSLMSCFDNPSNKLSVSEDSVPFSMVGDGGNEVVVIGAIGVGSDATATLLKISTDAIFQMLWVASINEIRTKCVNVLIWAVLVLSHAL